MPIGSICVPTGVPGDVPAIAIMGGDQIASVGTILRTQMQFPRAAAKAVNLRFAVLAGAGGVDMRPPPQGALT